MSKKHYQQFADYIRKGILPENKEAAELAADMVAIIADHDNPDFNANRFYSACGIGDYWNLETKTT